jgi:hypothetical protein
MLTFNIHQRAKLNFIGIVELSMNGGSTKNQVQQRGIIDLLDLLSSPIMPHLWSITGQFGVRSMSCKESSNVETLNRANHGGKSMCR